MKKKLKEIEKLEQQIKSGELKNPEPEQLDKVKKKSQVQREISNLEKEIKNASQQISILFNHMKTTILQNTSNNILYKYKIKQNFNLHVISITVLS